MDNSINYRLTLKDFFSKGIKDAAGNVKSLDGNMNKLNSTIGNVGKAIGGLFAVSAIKDFGMAVIDSLKNYEYFSASLRTLLYGDANTAKALEGQLIKLAATTPFSLVDVQNGTKQLLAYGFETGKIVENMKMLGDVSSGVGAPLTDIVYLYGTLKTQGRAYTKDIMQFTSRGIPIIGLLAKQFHTTETEVQKLVEAGKVGFPQIEQAFKSMTSSGGQFFGMMDQQSKTVGGQISNLGDSWEQLKVNIGKSQTGIINSTVRWANKMVQLISQSFSKEDFILSSIEKRGGKKTSYLGGSEGYQAEIGSLAEMVQGSIQRSQKDTKSAEKEKIFLSNLAKVKTDNFMKEIKGVTDANLLTKYFAPQQNNRISIIKEGLEQVKSNIKLLKGAKINQSVASEGLAKIDRNTGSSAGVGSSTEVSGARPQNINISVERLADITIETTNVMDSPKQIKAALDKALLELLNDANLIAGR